MALVGIEMEGVVTDLGYTVFYFNNFDIPAVFRPRLLRLAAIVGDVLGDGHVSVRRQRPSVALDGEGDVAHAVHLLPHTAVLIVRRILGKGIVEVDLGEIQLTECVRIILRCLAGHEQTLLAVVVAKTCQLERTSSDRGYALVDIDLFQRTAGKERVFRYLL